MKLVHQTLRKLFSEFWEARDHKEVPPIPLVPQNDPTTLFTGSGMQPLVPYLLGEPHPLGEKLYNIQPCFRAQDIEEVGDNRHTTSFEMMGNWSFGTYFKKEQIPWFYEFLTQELKLDSKKLHVTVFGGSKDIPKDEESARTWDSLGIPKKRIYYYSAEKNWWSRSGVPENMPAGEPGGPDTEVFYDFGEDRKIHEHSKYKHGKCHPNCDCGRFLEIGNSVFMQYQKQEDGTFKELPKKNVDFGGGFERMLAAINDDPDMFKSDLYKEIIAAIERTSGKTYQEEQNKSATRIISDHLKASTFLIIDGVTPSNKEQGYVLRRLLRRSAVKMRALKGSLGKGGDFKYICESVLQTYGNVYFNKTRDTQLIAQVIEDEITRFQKSLEKGLREIQQVETIDGKKAFDFYQTYGFPLELTEELYREKGQTINHDQFQREFEKHKNLSRSSSVGKFKGGLADHQTQTIRYHTATHLVHQALFDVLGNGVRQEGSNITTERLRFDFSSLKKPTKEDIKKVEEIANKKVKEALPVSFVIISREKAFEVSARAFFRERYPDKVKVYYIGEKLETAYSKEFCGGPHVKNTKEVGKISIYKFENIGSNLYRLYAK